MAQPKFWTPGSFPTGDSQEPWTYVHGGVCVGNDGAFYAYPALNGTCEQGSNRDQGNLG